MGTVSPQGNYSKYDPSQAEERLGWAATYMLNDWAVVPVPLRAKAPVLKEWQHLRITPLELEKYFQGAGNIGVLLGTPSGGLSDADVDAPEAHAAAPVFLPRTPMVSGRQSKPKSHWFYIATPTPASMVFMDPLIEDPKKSTLIELRANTKKQNGALATIVPPSIHPSGEVVRWESPPVSIFQLTRVPAPELLNAVTYVAICALVARYWPNKGEHGHDVVLALSGALLRARLELDVVKKIVLTAAAIAGYPRAKEADIDDTSYNLREGRPVTGWPRLAGLLPEKVVDQLSEWLGEPSRAGIVLG